MNRMVFCFPVLAIAVCSVAIAEPRAGLFRNASLPIAEESAAPVSLVGFFYRGGGGYAPGCGDAAAPSCGAEPSCGAGAACGGDPWEGYCAPHSRHGRHFGHLFHRHGRCGGMGDVGCGCAAAAPTCGAEPTCGAAPSCGYDAAPACGGHCHFGHRLCGRGCGHGCRCVGHPHRFWANGWCGQVTDGYCGGHPVDCSGGAMEGPAKAAPMPDYAPEPMPMDEPAKSTRRPLLTPRFSARPIGAGVQ